MSIIDDALKKTQEKLENQQDGKAKKTPPESGGSKGREGSSWTASTKTSTPQTPKPAAPSTPKTTYAPPAAEGPKPKRNYTVLVVGCVLISIGLLVSMSDVLDKFKASKKPLLPIPQERIVPMSRSTTPASGLKINGVMTIEDKVLILINNEIYEKGDVFDGKKIVDITLGQIQFRENGEVKIIKIGK